MSAQNCPGEGHLTGCPLAGLLCPQGGHERIRTGSQHTHSGAGMKKIKSLFIYKRMRHTRLRGKGLSCVISTGQTSKWLCATAPVGANPAGAARSKGTSHCG